MHKKVDYLIVGQGLAGSLLYWHLLQQGKKVFVIDQFDPYSSSRIAPGIIHPITGRRIIKTWMAEQLIPFAADTYLKIEEHFKQKLFHKINILELIHSVKEQNDWSIKSAEEELKNYFSSEVTAGLYADLLNGNPAKTAITQSGWLNVGKMLGAFREELIKNELLLNEELNYDRLSVTSRTVTYKHVEADHLFFCQGHQGKNNPYWNHLPFIPAKGELLIIRSAHLNLNHILNQKICILPIGEHLFKVGSTYSWNDLTAGATEKARENLLNQLDSMIQVPYEVVDHLAAIRPTVKDRRPFIGLHPRQARVGIFNGLGTKGVLLAPYFSNHLVAFLQGKSSLLPEVDVARFA